MTIYEGSMTVDGTTVVLSGTTVFDLLDAGGVNFPPLVKYFEARKGRWGGYLDTNFIGLNFENEFSTRLPGRSISADLDFTYILINAGLIYTVAEWTEGTGTTAFDFMGGLRYTHYDIDLDIDPLPVDLSATLDWWDITLCARLRGEYDSGWFWSLRGDLAGADIEARFSAQVVGAFGRDFTLGSVNMSWMAGYRYLYQEWDDGADAVDLTTHGPMVGLRFRF